MDKLIIEALTDETEFILINFYNANTENVHLATFSELSNLLENFDLINLGVISICFLIKV